VNKVATAVQLRFDVANSPSLPQEVRQRLLKLGGSRITAEGVLLIQSQRQRTQEQNREEALQRLVELVRRAAIPPKKRYKTRPTKASQERRLEGKRRRGLVKRLRQGKGELE
jgi:ribosome-associated protein